MITFIGVDGGLHGAICFQESSTPIKIIPMPIIKDATGKFILNIENLSKLFSSLSQAFVTIEKAHPMPVKGSIGNFSTGYTFGVVTTLLVAYRIPHQIVAARTWQTYFFKDMSKQNTKAASIIIAKRLFPDVNLTPENCKKESDGFSDALLIAEYGKRMYGKE